MQNSTFPYRLNPDCRGKFQVIADDTEYTLAEILERFPLPQRIKLVKENKHSEELLRLVSPGEQQVRQLILKSQSQEEYVISEHLNTKNHLLVNLDADLRFLIPESTYLSRLNLNLPGQSSKVASGGEDIEVLRLDNMICEVKEKRVVCKTRDEIFISLPTGKDLPDRPVKSSTNRPLPSPHSGYENFTPVGMSKRDRHGKVGSPITKSSMVGSFLERETKEPRYTSEPRRSISGRPRMMTPDETRKELGKVNGFYLDAFCP